MVFEGKTILVAHPDDLIAPLRMHKAKHQERLPHLEAIRDRLEGGEKITPLMPPPSRLSS